MKPARFCSLTQALMRYDAANHPDPTAFDRWAEGGPCPYNGVSMARSAHFHEIRRLWSPGPAESAYALAQRLLSMYCPDWPEPEPEPEDGDW